MHLDESSLTGGLAAILAKPRDNGVKALFRRPTNGERERLREAELTRADGVVGDNWRHRVSSRTPDGTASVDTQVTIMGSSFLELIAGAEDRWELAGDQIIVDFDLAAKVVPTGTRLRVGSALLEVTAPPHTGCGKFAERYGAAAKAFVNTPQGRALNLRGVNAQVIEEGRVRVGDVIAIEV